jgi:galactokinase/mevalonate kinase-like predicted kinase
VARHGIRHIAVEEAERSRKAAEEGEVVDSHIHLVVEVGRNSEACKHVNSDNRRRRASNPTGSSLAGASTAVVVVVVVLHILRGSQVQDRLTFLLDNAIEKKKMRYRRWQFGAGPTPKGASER